MEALAEKPDRRLGQLPRHGAGGLRDGALRLCERGLVRGKPIIEYQAVAHRLADMATDVRTMRWMVYRRRVDQGTCDMALASRSSCIVRKQQCACRSAIRVLGGAGLMREYPVGRIHRDALVT